MMKWLGKRSLPPAASKAEGSISTLANGVAVGHIGAANKASQ